MSIIKLATTSLTAVALVAGLGYVYAQATDAATPPAASAAPATAPSGNPTPSSEAAVTPDTGTPAASNAAEAGSGMSSEPAAKADRN